MELAFGSRGVFGIVNTRACGRIEGAGFMRATRFNCFAELPSFALQAQSVREWAVASFAGAWIETTADEQLAKDYKSPPSRGGVDRNRIRKVGLTPSGGRLLRGGVDRNRACSSTGRNGRLAHLVSTSRQNKDNDLAENL